MEFRGPSATSGYFRNPEATDALLRRDWLRTGDLGYLATGDLYLTGSLEGPRDRGRPQPPPRTSSKTEIGDLPGVRKGCVAVFGVPDPSAGTERLVVLAETHQTGGDELARLRGRGSSTRPWTSSARRRGTSSSPHPAPCSRRRAARSGARPAPSATCRDHHGAGAAPLVAAGPGRRPRRGPGRSGGRRGGTGCGLRAMVLGPPGGGGTRRYWRWSPSCPDPCGGGGRCGSPPGRCSACRGRRWRSRAPRPGSGLAVRHRVQPRQLAGRPRAARLAAGRRHVRGR